MKTLCEAWCNGIALSSVDDHIYVVDIAEEQASYDTNTVTLGRGGRRVTGNRREGISVTVYIEIHDAKPNERQSIAERVNEWASGNELRVSSREGQKLICRCANKAAVASALKYTGVVGIVFESTYCPSFEDFSTSTATADGEEAECTLSLRGNAEGCPVSVNVSHDEEMLNNLTLTVGSTSMSFTGLNLAPEEVLSIGYENGILFVRCGDTSLLSRRTPESDDDLLARGGSNDCAVTADTSVTATFSARGRFE